MVPKTGPLGGHEAATYFLFSLVYLLSRSVAVSLIASQVNSASSVPAPVLYDVPSPVYCIEVCTVLEQDRYSGKLLRKKEKGIENGVLITTSLVKLSKAMSLWDSFRGCKDVCLSCQNVCVSLQGIFFYIIYRFLYRYKDF